jgi:hypothetical protein
MARFPVYLEYLSFFKKKNPDYSLHAAVFLLGRSSSPNVSQFFLPLLLT